MNAFEEGKKLVDCPRFDTPEEAFNYAVGWMQGRFVAFTHHQNDEVLKLIEIKDILERSKRNVDFTRSYKNPFSDTAGEYSPGVPQQPDI